MKKFFPNIETAIIFVFVICVLLWGVTRCNRKKDEMTIKAVTEGVTDPLLQDSSISSASPAARKGDYNPAATVPPPPTTDPNQGMAVVPPPQYPTATTGQNPNQSVASPATTPRTSTTTPLVPGQTTAAPVPTPIPAPSGTLLYVLIDGLNVRTTPDLKAKSLGKLKLNDQVYFLNEVTPEAQTVRLIDKSEVTKPWFKIKTKRGTVGWVHGSGVDFYKRKPQGTI